MTPNEESSLTTIIQMGYFKIRLLIVRDKKSINYFFYKVKCDFVTHHTYLLL